jgi:hypothetical protein
MRLLFVFLWLCFFATSALLFQTDGRLSDSLLLATAYVLVLLLGYVDTRRKVAISRHVPKQSRLEELL